MRYAVQYELALSPARYSMISPEDFQRAIAASPHDMAARGAYADYLEERDLHHDEGTLDRLRGHHGPVLTHTLPNGKVFAVPSGPHPYFVRMSGPGEQNPVHPVEYPLFEQPGSTVAVVYRPGGETWFSAVPHYWNGQEAARHVARHHPELHPYDHVQLYRDGNPVG